MATIRELLANDPIQHGLANDGQARLRNEPDAAAERELMAELRSFVCEGQYADALDRVLSAYLKALNGSRQVAAWVSGFFGSGKSHLLKMAGHLWVNTRFEDGSTARELVVGLPEVVTAHLRELDNNAKRFGVPRVAAMGQLPAGDAEFVRATIASIVLAAQGLPQQIPSARFVLWLREQGIEAAVRKSVEQAGKDWLSEVANLAVSPVIAGAVMRAIPNFANSEADARMLFAKTYPPPRSDLTTEEFIQIVRSALATAAGLPLAVVVLDEVQQYIGDSIERATIVTEAVEALYTRLDSRVLVIAAGQSALGANDLLMRLRDRFKVTSQLSDTDVEAVTRKVVLLKKPAHERAIEEVLERHAGEIARHLSAAAGIAHRDTDRATRVIDYPLLPTRRRFWEACFKAVDGAGTQSQLRSQLKVIHSCVADAALRPLGYAIPGDRLYGSIADKLVNTAVLIPELYNRIDALADGTREGLLRQRICGLIFLISRLPREQGNDLGVRSTAGAVADLMVEDLTTDSGPFRSEVERLLEGLVADGTLMRVEEEYRLQTREGQAWEAAFRAAEQSFRSQTSDVERVREQHFAEAIQQLVAQVRTTQGEAKIKRSLQTHFDPSEPPAGAQIVVWVRDGWSTRDREVLESARARGTEDPVIHLFIPKKEADTLRGAIIDSLAAQRVLEQKSGGFAREAEEAQQSMAGRKSSADRRIATLVREILRGAEVYQGGGARIQRTELAQALSDAAKASVDRLYPRFAEADSALWDRVIHAAKDGADEPLAPVGHRGAVESHGVCRDVLEAIGTGHSGSAIRKRFEQPPFGWPRDAIDAALLCLHRAGIVSATRNGSRVEPGALDQAGIPSTEFRRERIVIGTGDRLKVRGICLHLTGHSPKQNLEEAALDAALLALRDLAQRAGGDPPRPPVPTAARLDELLSISGAARLQSAAEHDGEIKALHDQWKAQAQRVASRLPAWERLQALAARAGDLPEAAAIVGGVAAIEADRLLLVDPDPVAPLLRDLTVLLRTAIGEAHAAHVAAVDRAREVLAQDGGWSKIDPATQRELLVANRIDHPPQPDLASDESLLGELAAHPIGSRRSLPEIVASRVPVVLAEAARRLAPKSRSVRIAPATLHTAEEVEAWVAARKRELLDAVGEGPVVIG